jgi:hypothetical protein
VIQIGSVEIKELRGIRDLTLEMNRESFVISGPNGSGIDDRADCSSDYSPEPLEATAYPAIVGKVPEAQVRGTVELPQL